LLDQYAFFYQEKSTRTALADQFFPPPSRFSACDDVVIWGTSKNDAVSVKLEVSRGLPDSGQA